MQVGTVRHGQRLGSRRTPAAATSYTINESNNMVIRVDFRLTSVHDSFGVLQHFDKRRPASADAMWDDAPGDVRPIGLDDWDQPLKFPAHRPEYRGAQIEAHE